MEVTEKIHWAYRRLIAKDAYLLKVEANERSITHRFAIYIEQEFPEFNVDCEFNRKGLEVKRLPAFGIDPRTIEKEGINLFPDIIVHHRGTDNNLVAIEGKPSTKHKNCLNNGDCSCDVCKLRAYRIDLKYKHTFYVIFPVGEHLESFSDAKLGNYIHEIQ